MSIREFGVHGVEPTAGGATEVIGRCFRGPIMLGQAFTGLGRSAGHTDVRVHLTVVGIVAYGHHLSELDEGLTGRLTLEGLLPPDLADGSVLRLE